MYGESSLHFHFTIAQVVGSSPSSIIKSQNIPKQRQLLEYLRIFDVCEVSLNFKDNVHGGDKRKTSQQCS